MIELEKWTPPPRGHVEGSALLMITVLKGPAEGKTFRLDDHETHRIGRESGPLPLEDSRISRDHAEIAPGDHDDFIIRDLGSTNGTLVNGRKIDGPTRIHDGDQVQLGRSLMLVNVVADDEASDFIAPTDVALRHPVRPTGRAAGGSVDLAPGVGGEILQRLEALEQKLTAGSDQVVAQKLDRLLTAIETQPTSAIPQRLTEILRAVNAHSTAALEQRVDRLAAAVQPVDTAGLEAAVEKLSTGLKSLQGQTDHALREELQQIRSLLSDRGDTAAGTAGDAAELHQLQQKLDTVVESLSALRLGAAEQVLTDLQRAVAELPSRIAAPSPAPVLDEKVLEVITTTLPRPADHRDELQQLRAAVETLTESVDFDPVLKKLEHDPAEPLLKQILTVVESTGHDDLHRKVNALLEQSTRAADYEKIHASLAELKQAIAALPAPEAPAEAVDLTPVTQKLSVVADAVAGHAALFDDLRHRLESLPHRLDEGQAMQRMVETQIVGRIAPLLEEVREAVMVREDKPAVDPQVTQKLDTLLKTLESRTDQSKLITRLDQLVVASSKAKPVEIAGLERRLEAVIEQLGELRAQPTAVAPAPSVDLSPLEAKLTRVLEESQSATSQRQDMLQQIMQRMEKSVERTAVATLDAPAPVTGDAAEPLMREMRETEAMLQRVSEQVDSLSGQVNQQVLGEILLLLRSIDVQQRQHAEMLQELRSAAPAAVAPGFTDTDEVRFIGSPVELIEPRWTLRRAVITAVAALAIPVTGWFAYHSYAQMKQTSRTLEVMRTQTDAQSGQWQTVR